MYLYQVGEPIFIVDGPDQMPIPAGQAELGLEVLRQQDNPEGLSELLFKEYVAIVAALKGMNVPFRIVCAHRRYIRPEILGALFEFFGCRGIGYPSGCPRNITLYPRDMCIRLPGLTLLSEGMALGQGAAANTEVIVSPFGEGGQTLVAGRTVFIGEQLALRKDGRAQPQLVTGEDLTLFTGRDLRVILLPMPLLTWIERSGAGVSDQQSWNSHLDRVYAALTDGRGDVHLIVGNETWAARITAEKTATTPVRWEPMTPEETLADVRQRCAGTGITVHQAPPLTVPYGLNLLQTPDGRVLMTSGDEELRRFIGGIIGHHQVVTTEIPIQFTPVWRYAGIRCLVGDDPGY